MAASCVQRINKYRVFFGDEAASYFACAGQLIVIRIKLFVQHKEAVNLGISHHRVMDQLSVDLLDTLTDQFQHLGPTGQINSLEPPVFQIQGGKPVVIHPAAIKQGELKLGVQ